MNALKIRIQKKVYELSVIQKKKEKLERKSSRDDLPETCKNKR